MNGSTGSSGSGVYSSLIPHRLVLLMRKKYLPDMKHPRIVLKILCIACSFLIVALLFSCASRKIVQQPADSSDYFDTTAFQRTCALAEEFALDDRLAWLSTDSIMAEKPMLLDSLDRTWFVDKRENARYAFYGRYFAGSGEYRPKYIFRSDTPGTVVKISTDVTDARTVRFARAVSTANASFRHLVDSMQVNVDYNHYIRENGDKSFSVWFFPAGYGTYCAHGLDFRLGIDPSGSAVTGHEAIGTCLRYFEIDKRDQAVVLDNTYAATPSLGNVFFVLRNRDRFDRIVIRNSTSKSTMVFSPEKNAWEWVRK